VRQAENGAEYERQKAEQRRSKMKSMAGGRR
jgi:hypothetical protein